MPTDPYPGTTLPRAEDQALVQTLRKTGPGHVLFERFELVRELGEGGMGVVWLAVDHRLDKREVALKFLPGLVVQDLEAIADLRREIRHGLDLNHPGVVRVYDLHESRSEKLAAIAMEYIRGKTLSDLKVERLERCFNPADILPWLLDLCDILHYVHSEVGLVHRDLKPRNVMVTDRGKVKLADFGIAAAITESHSRLTAKSAGNTSGTLPYMSPQQAQGRPAKVSDDIYSLGATVYELLAGKPPFYKGSAPAVILHQILHEAPISMTERRRDLGIEDPQPLPPEWEELVSECLAKRSGDRPIDCGILRERFATLPLRIEENGSSDDAVEYHKIECPWCGQRLEVPGDVNLECPTCTCEFEYRTAEDEIVWEEVPIVVTCPKCDGEDQILVQETKEYQCADCGEYIHFERVGDEAMFDVDPEVSEELSISRRNTKAVPKGKK